MAWKWTPAVVRAGRSMVRKGSSLRAAAEYLGGTHTGLAKALARERKPKPKKETRGRYSVLTQAQQKKAMRIFKVQQHCARSCRTLYQ